jgi:putative transposase
MSMPRDAGYMARGIRIEFAGAVYHVTARGNRRKRIFVDDADHERFLELLAEAVKRFRWVITSYSLMGNHFHLVIETPEPNLARGMQWLNVTYAAWFNKRHQKVGHLFGERYKAIHVEASEYMQRLARYVVLNPVRATIVEHPRDFRWSSYAATAGLVPIPAWLHVERLAPYFGADGSWRTNYIQFVDRGIQTPDPIWRGLRRNIFLSSEQWLVAMKQRITCRRRKMDIPHDHRAAGRPAMRRIVNTISKISGVPAAIIRAQHGGSLRQISAWLGVYEGMRRLRVIAQTLRLGSCSRVTQLAQECERRLRRDSEYRKLVESFRLALT